MNSRKIKAVVKPWIFYEAGEEVVAYGPNPYLALYYIEQAAEKNLMRYQEIFLRK